MIKDVGSDQEASEARGSHGIWAELQRMGSDGKETLEVGPLQMCMT